MILINAIVNASKIFGLFTIFYVVVTWINFYQAKYIEPSLKELAKYNFYLLVVYWILNIIVTFAFSMGVNKFGIPAWTVTVIYWSAAVIPALILIYFWFGQLPTLNQWLGIILVLSGVVLVNIK